MGVEGVPTVGVTVMFKALDVAGLPDTQVAFDVITTVIMSPFTRVVVVYVEPVAPGMFTPPFFHW